MATSRKRTSNEEAAQTKKVVRSQKAHKAESSRQRQSELKCVEKRQQLLGSFSEGAHDFFRNIGIELSKLDDGTLNDIRQGKLTNRPLELTVNPIVYDSTNKVDVVMPPLKTLDFIRFAEGKDGKFYLSTVPCRPLVDMSAQPQPAPSVNLDREVNFSEAQVMALESVGLSRNRLYGGFNGLTKEEKIDILDGSLFPVDGSVKTDFGFVNVSGIARMNSEADGKVSMSFYTNEPSRLGENMKIDLVGASIIPRLDGQLELDFTMRSPNGRKLTSTSGEFIRNAAAENLLNYGVAMEPVKGYLHRREWDRKENKFVEKTVPGWYEVSVPTQVRKVGDGFVRYSSGNLFVTQMNEVVKKNSKGVEETVPQCRNSHVKDGRVYVDGASGKPLELKDDAQVDMLLSGRPAIVKDAVFKDFKTGKEQHYEGVVVLNNQKAGFAKLFSPEASREIRESMKKTMNVVNRRKKGFGVGF